MAKATTKAEIGIQLPKLDLRVMEVTVIGDSPLIVHAWSAKSKKEMLDKQMKAAKGARQAKDPVADFQEAMYRLGEGHGFPSVAFKTAAVDAATSVAGVTKVAARQAFHIIGIDVDIEGAFPGSISRNNLVPVFGSEPRMREDMVRVGMGTADLRYRAEYTEWYSKLLVRYNANVLSESQILNLINLAGFAVGVGEWRPQKEGQYGLFHVAAEAEFNAIEGK